jgi:CheY-like chemotaxis protein
MPAVQKHVLLVEDNLGDALLAEECFKRTGQKVRLHHVQDGDQCIAFLRKEGKYKQAPVPDLVLLDINMPRMSGHEVMRELLADDRLRHLPVVVLTTSSSPADIQAMLNQRCSSYIVKPHDLAIFQKVIQGMCDYWFNLPGLVTSTKPDDFKRSAS